MANIVYSCGSALLRSRGGADSSMPIIIVIAVIIVGIAIVFFDAVMDVNVVSSTYLIR